MSGPEDIEAGVGTVASDAEELSAAAEEPSHGETLDEVEAAERWVPPPFQPLHTLAALLLTAAGFGLYEYLMFSFWSSSAMGIHERIPYPAYASLAGAILLTLAAVRVALTVRAPHWKLGLVLLALLACVAEGLGGGRFVTYTVKGTLNPSYVLNLKLGDHFPSFALPDQNGVTRRGPRAAADGKTLIVIYRGDFCPFARFELGKLSRARGELSRIGLDVVAISADPVERSRMLAGFLHTDIPLLSDVKGTVLAPLGLVQRHRNGEPDNAIPAFFILDRDGVVRWIFTSPYYREMPSLETLLDAAARVKAAN